MPLTLLSESNYHVNGKRQEANRHSCCQDFVPWTHRVGFSQPHNWTVEKAAPRPSGAIARSCLPRGCQTKASLYELPPPRHFSPAGRPPPAMAAELAEPSREGCSPGRAQRPWNAGAGLGRRDTAPAPLSLQFLTCLGTYSSQGLLPAELSADTEVKHFRPNSLKEHRLRSRAWLQLTQ